MTLIALNEVEEDVLEAGVCIIGAGPAGITLASELHGSNQKVLLLEAGGLRFDSSLSENYRGSASDPHPEPAEYRRSAFGGTSAIWGGRCIPFDPIDLEQRDYVANSGWPVGYEELARYYPRAMKYCDAGTFDFSLEGSLAGARPTIEGFEAMRDAEGAVVLDRIERYSLPTHFGRRYRDNIAASKNVLAIIRARCLRLIRRRGSERVDSAEIVDAAGRKRLVRAKVFVLATGGIEVPRILMLSDPEGAGLGNQNDCLGRYYMCHFESTFGRVVPRGLVQFDFERTTDGVFCRRQLGFTAEAQRRHGLFNTAFRLHFPNYSDASHRSSALSAIYLAKSTLIPEYRSILEANGGEVASPVHAHLRNIATDVPQLIRFVSTWLFRIRLATRKLPYTLVANADGTFPLEFNSEQTPLAGNRITLGDEFDPDGLRRVHIEWRLSREDQEAARRACLLLRDTLNRSGACRLEVEEARLQERIAASRPLGGHHIGTARMSASERHGVVDRNCRVFGVPNLYVASAAVFPTSSHANPTLTIVALAIRLAEHLRSLN